MLDSFYHITQQTSRFLPNKCKIRLWSVTSSCFVMKTARKFTHQEWRHSITMKSMTLVNCSRSFVHSFGYFNQPSSINSNNVADWDIDDNHHRYSLWHGGKYSDSIFHAREKILHECYIEKYWRLDITRWAAIYVIKINIFRESIIVLICKLIIL